MAFDDNAHCYSRDFNAPVKNRSADTSAAMIAANGLLLLGKHETDSSLAYYWIDEAIQVFFIDYTAL